MFCVIQKNGVMDGIESFIMNIYRNLDLNKINFYILSSQDITQMYDEEIKRLGGKRDITIEEIYKSPIMRTLKNLTVFNKKIKERKYDVIHLNICHGVAMIYAYMAKKAGIKKVIIHSHSTGIGKKSRKIKRIAHIICKYIFEKYATEYLACSDKAAEWLFTRKNLKNVKIIPNGINVEKFLFNKEYREEIRKDLNISNQQLIIGNVGRLSEEKNQAYLIDIFKEIYEINKDAILLIVGEGELRKELEKKIQELNIKSNVILYGRTKQPEKIYCAIDIFVLPSLFEGSPVSGIEAQASGLNCFFSDTITKTSNITGKVNFISIKDNPNIWKEKILDTKVDIQDRKKDNIILKKAGYDIKDIAKKIMNIYES